MKYKNRYVQLALFVCTFFVLTSSVWASDLFVNTVQDSNSLTCSTNPNGCSLRAAILFANTNSDTDTIHLTVPGIYALNGYLGANEDYGTTGDLDIRHSVIISNESGGVVRIDGAASDRVFDIVDEGALTKTVVAEFKGVIIQNGDADFGGGIRGTGIKLVNSTVQKNHATVDGGGIWGQAEVVSSSIYNNKAEGNGGGFYVLDPGVPSSIETSSILNSTISHNMTLDGFGGGLYNGPETSVDLIQVTLNKNYSLGGASLANDPNGGILSVSNTILSDIFDANTLPNCFGAIHSKGYNLNSNTIDNCSFDINKGDIIGKDPELGPFGYNGGPTPTHLPNITSPVIDAGMDTSTAIGVDQRGIARTGLYDIGAVESISPIDIQKSSSHREAKTKGPLFDPSIWMKKIQIKKVNTLKPGH